MATISDAADARRPPAWMLMREGAALLARFYRAFGSLEERGPADGPRLMLIPGFMATDRTTLGSAARAGRGRLSRHRLGPGPQHRRPGGHARPHRRADRGFGGGQPVILVGWSLGGVFAREAAKRRPDLVAKVITMGSPFSGDPRSNNAWRLYEWVAGHPVDDPPIETVLGEKPPVPTLALWSRRDGIVAVACGARRARRMRPRDRARLQPHGLRRQRPRLSEGDRGDPVLLILPDGRSRNGSATSFGTLIGRPLARSMIAQVVLARTRGLPSSPTNSTWRSKRAPLGASPTQVRPVTVSPGPTARR